MVGGGAMCVVSCKLLVDCTLLGLKDGLLNDSSAEVNELLFCVADE